MSAGAVGSVAAGETSSAGILVKSPAVLMAPRADGVEVVWAVGRLSRGRVEWRSDDGTSGVAAADGYGFTPQGAGVLKVRVQGLAPGTGYTLRAITEAIDGEKERSEGAWKKFRTLSPSAKISRFVVWNDTHENQETLTRLHQVTPTADFLVWNGDTCNDWHDESRLAPTLLNPGGNDVTEGRPLCLTLGNHDLRGKYAFRVKDFTAAPEARPYYAFRSGPVAAIFLCTGEDKPDSHPSFAGRVAFQQLREEQALWLREITARLEMESAPYKIIFCHIPLRWVNEPDRVDYANGAYDHYAKSSRDLWHQALVDWGAQVVISGHTHREAWIPADEKFPYGQLIGGGPKPDDARWIEGVADESGLKFTIRDLQKEITLEAKLPPLGG
jgi:predicted phosphodiesterase